MQTPEGYLLLGQPTLAEQTMRALELKGDLPQLVDPRFQLGVTTDDWTSEEYLWLRRTQPIVYNFAVAANVGFPSTGQLSQPAFRPLLRIQRIIVLNANAALQQLQIYFAAAAGGGVAFGVGGGAPRDDRAIANAAAIASATGSGQFTVGTGNTAVIPTVPAVGAVNVQIPASSTAVFELPWVCTGKFFFTVATVAVNQSLNCYLVGYERHPLTPELG